LTRQSVIGDDSLDIEVDEGGERTLVRLRGRVGIDSSPELRDRLLTILQGQTPKTVIVDLAEVASIEASGIATLLEALKIARNRQATLCLKGLQGRAARFFEVTGLLGVFQAATGCEGDSPGKGN